MKYFFYFIRGEWHLLWPLNFIMRKNINKFSNYICIDYHLRNSMVNIGFDLIYILRCPISKYIIPYLCSIATTWKMQLHYHLYKSFYLKSIAKLMINVFVSQSLQLCHLYFFFRYFNLVDNFLIFDYLWLLKFYFETTFYHWTEYCVFNDVVYY